ncbi:chemotaxis protein CheW [Mesobacillus foraminis]|uniref:chemotaxis protein CheW n=1 Tax=Mesobacillus foraminis TaxID=279826 RepID=UPI00214B730E|nr:chemotaxis protein CheW [Mesobacillus foraminis]
MSETSKAVIFQAGNEEFALPIFNVISIEKTEEITPVPQMPDFFMGVVKVRDHLIPAIDSEAILYQRRLQPDNQTRMIVLDGRKGCNRNYGNSCGKHSSSLTGCLS